MPKIDFYIIPETTSQARLALACRLIEKAYKNRNRVYIHTDNQTDAHQLDELLWTYRDDSFLPHNLYGEGPDTAPPIQIGCNITPNNHRDILINLSQEVPAFYTQFSRILELVSGDTAIQEYTRNHYRLYRSHNYDVQTHKLETLTPAPLPSLCSGRGENLE